MKSLKDIINKYDINGCYPKLSYALLAQRFDNMIKELKALGEESIKTQTSTVILQNEGIHKTLNSLHNSPNIEVIDVQYAVSQGKHSALVTFIEYTKEIDK